MFITNTGNILQAVNKPNLKYVGGFGGYPHVIQLPDDSYRFVGIWGRSGARIDKLGFLVR